MDTTVFNTREKKSSVSFFLPSVLNDTYGKSRVRQVVDITDEEEKQGYISWLPQTAVVFTPPFLLLNSRPEKQQQQQQQQHQTRNAASDYVLNKQKGIATLAWGWSDWHDLVAVVRKKKKDQPGRIIHSSLCFFFLLLLLLLFRLMVHDFLFLILLSSFKCYATSLK